jgi:hypothetical protein
MGHRRLATLLVLVVASALIAAVGAPRGLALTQPGTIRITGKEIKHRHVDLGERGMSAGDEDFYRVQLFNKGITPSSLGHADIVCTYTGSQSTNCMGSYFLPQGKIVVGGIIGSKLFYQLPVLGGTGIYGNVRGTLTVTAIGESPPRSLFVFRLVIS